MDMHLFRVLNGLQYWLLFLQFHVYIDSGSAEQVWKARFRTCLRKLLLALHVMMAHPLIALDIVLVQV
jgi:hypothetical protein